VRAKRPSPVSRLLRFGARHRVELAIALTAALVIIVGTEAGRRRFRRAQELRQVEWTLVQVRE